MFFFKHANHAQEGLCAVIWLCLSFHAISVCSSFVFHQWYLTLATLSLYKSCSFEVSCYFHLLYIALKTWPFLSSFETKEYATLGVKGGAGGRFQILPSYWPEVWCVAIWVWMSVSSLEISQTPPYAWICLTTF